MASKAKQIYWAVRHVLTSGPPGQMVSEWESQTGDRKLPDDHFETVLYFADGPVNLYQLRQWYEPLRQWNEQSPTLLLCRSVSAALALLDECPVTVAYVPRIDDIERLVNHQRFRLALYVNHHQRNFQMLRFIDMLHVYISHGESDKHYMVSGQIKAYDYTFIAGEAAANRLNRFLLNYDVPTRTKTIGRPQLDTPPAKGPDLPDDGKMVVLYAPTWEGDRPSMSYGSIPSHGAAMVKALISTGRHRVIVRPHPRTGVINDQQTVAREEVRTIIAEANAADPSAQHIFDESPNFDWQLGVADIAISDVSAAAIDWLTTGKPLVVTKPAEVNAILPEEGYLSTLDLLPADRAGEIADVLDATMNDERSTAERLKWTTFYFGDITPGVATQLWLDACREVVDTCEAQRAERGGDAAEFSDITEAAKPMSVLEEAEFDS